MMYHVYTVPQHGLRHAPGSSLEVPSLAGALVRNGAIFTILLAVLAAMNLRNFFSGGPADVTPLKAPLLKDLPQFQGQYADDMLWGTYRSGLYFGMRTRWVGAACCCISAALRAHCCCAAHRQALKRSGTASGRTAHSEHQ
jgi:hypothetical protein